MFLSYSCLGPLYIYILYEVLGNNLPSSGLHILPFIIYLAYSFNFFLQPEALKYNIVAGMLNPDIPRIPVQLSFPHDPWDIQGWVVVEIISMHLLLYSILSFLKLLRLKKNHSSSMHRWSIFLNANLAIAALVLFLSEGGIVNGKVFFESPFPAFSGDLFGTASTYLTTLYVLFWPDFLKKSTKKYAKSTLPKELRTNYMERIRRSIETDKPFLDPGFSLDMLAEKTGIAKHHLSQIINQEMNCSFFELTNKYRIEEAKNRIRSSEFVKMEVLAYEMGYRSKSSFFNAFKKATRQTPTQFSVSPS